MPELQPCPECSRHVRVADAECPFCGTAIEPTCKPGACHRGPKRVRGRAGLLAAGAVAGSLAAGGCWTAHYGAPPRDAGIEDAGDDGGEDDGGAGDGG